MLDVFTDQFGLLDFQRSQLGSGMSGRSIVSSFFCWFFFSALQSTSSYLVLLFVFHFFDVFYSVCCLLIVYQFKVTYSRNTTAKMWCNKFILSSSSFFAKAQEVYICTAEGCRTDIQLHFYCAADVADFKGKRYILYFWWRTDIEK